MTVYLDLLIGVNFAVDFLLLLSADRLAGYHDGCGRMAAGALAGALYAGMCVLPGFSFLGNGFWRMISLLLIGFISFGMHPSALQRCAVFGLLSMALGGAALAIRASNSCALLVCGGVLWLVCTMGFRGPVGQHNYVQVEMEYGNQRVKLYALRDTGNSLRDPITGQQVLIADAQIGVRLLGIPEQMIKNPVQLIESGMVPGLRLISYHSVGQPGSMLPMIRLRNVKIGNTYSDALVAFAPERIGRGDCYQMLAGGAI